MAEGGLDGENAESDRKPVKTKSNRLRDLDENMRTEPKNQSNSAPKSTSMTVEEHRQIIVLGMHRSGTSALTNALAIMGVFVGDQEELTASNWENPNGFFERRDARRICDALLHSVEADWWKVSQFDAGKIGFPVLGDERKALTELRDKLDAKGNWALKEPRLCLLLNIVLPYFSRALPIVVLRHPIEIAISLHHRNGFPIQAALALWETYILRALSESDHLQRCFVHYDALVSSPAATLGQLTERLEALGVSGLDPARGAEAIDPSLLRERHNGEQDWRLSPEQAHLWAMLKDLNIAGDDLKVPEVSPHAEEILREFETDQMAWQALKAEKGALKREIDTSAKRVSEIHEQHQKALVELKETRERLANTTDVLAQALHSLDATRKEAAQSGEAFADRDAKLLIANSERDAMRDEANKASIALADRDAKLLIAYAERDAMRDEASKASIALAEREAKLLLVSNERDTMRDEAAQANKALADRDKELLLAKSERDATYAELDRSEAAFNDQNEIFLSTREKLEEREEAFGRLSRDFARTTASREALQSELTAQRRMAEKQARAHQDMLRRAVERSADEVRAFGRARHKAAEQIASLEWNLNLAARDNASLEAEREADTALIDAMQKSTLWRVLARARRVAQTPFRAIARRNRLARIVSMVDVMTLFDPAWYSKRNPDVALSGQDPLDHYLLRGAIRGRDPGPLFHVALYLDRAEAIGEGERAARNPLVHYLQTGEAAGLSPHALFDPTFYATENPDVDASDMNLLAHFIRHGGQEGRSPSPYFDARWYLDVNEDVAAAASNALLHYLDRGADEGRDPAPNFSTRGYLRSYPDVLRSGQNPLVHYQQFGRYEGRNPLGLGDPTAPIATSASTASAAGSTTGQTTLPQSVSANLPSVLPDTPPPAVPKLASQSKLPLNALLISWDIGHNPLGRAYMLAEAVDRVVEHTVIAGFQFPRYGTRVWEPLRDSRLPVIPIAGDNLPNMIDLVRMIADQVRPDVVIACKPRLPALQLGMHVRDAAGCPLILDIDDHELSFFANRDPITLAQLESVEPGSWAKHVEPYGENWTRLCEGMTDTADRILVSNTALQKRFGGVVLPHVRDETVFRPVDAKAREATRTRFGVPTDAHVVLFFGTPRLHKGVGELAEAVAGIDDPKVRLVIVGDAPDKSVTSKLNQIAPGQVIQIPGQPFSAIPEIMALGDVVALPQDVDHPISQFQLPAKAIDAIAAGLPLLVTPTPPLMDLVEAGLAIPFEPERLKEAIVASLNSRQTPQSLAAARERFLKGYSYHAAGETLREVIGEAVSQKHSKATIGKSNQLTTAQCRALGCEPQGPAKAVAKRGRDIVMFWKQNDSALYGRRNDMVARYLASRDDVRRVIVFDAPISRNKLIELRDHGRPGDQDRLIYTRTVEKLMGLRDEGKIVRRTLVYQPRDVHGKTTNGLQNQMFNFVRAKLEQENVDPSRSVFWLYPHNPFLEALVDEFKPARVVTDIVDDHRAWPNVSEDRRRELDQHYHNVLSFADFATANCEPVRASMAKIRPDIRLIPNGCDTITTPVIPSSSAFERVSEWAGKVIGFTGNLEAKIDGELITRLAHELPDALIVLVGSTHANPSVRQLAQLPNVIMPGVAPYEELGAWVSRFDVAIIPHKRMALTDSMNPLKQYVYLSHGVPVVATNISGLEDVSGIALTSDHETFVDAVRKALENPHVATDTQAFINEHSWSARLSELVDEILAV